MRKKLHVKYVQSCSKKSAQIYLPEVKHKYYVNTTNIFFTLIYYITVKLVCEFYVCKIQYFLFTIFCISVLYRNY